MIKHIFVTLLLCFVFVTAAYADELPDIVPEAPVVVPATEAKTYNKQWLKIMIVRAPSPTEPATITFQLVPYDGAGAILEEPLKANTIPDAFALAEKDPQFAQVFGMVLTAINKYKNIDFDRPFTVHEDGTVTNDAGVVGGITWTGKRVE